MPYVCRVQKIDGAEKIVRDRKRMVNREAVSLDLVKYVAHVARVVVCDDVDIIKALHAIFV